MLNAIKAFQIMDYWAIWDESMNLLHFKLLSYIINVSHLLNSNNSGILPKSM